MSHHDPNDRLPRPGGHRQTPAQQRQRVDVRASPSRRRERMLTQNSYLRRINVFNFSIPAWAGKLPDGRNYNTCPSAGICSALCCARNGTYKFPQVLAKHQRNLVRVLDDLPQWEADMVEELGAAKFRGGKYVRYHDAGDFFSDDYTRAWLSVARAVFVGISYNYK